MPRPNTKKFAAFREVHLPVNWKKLVIEFLLMNRGRRFTSTEIKNALIKDVNGTNGLTEELVIKNVSATLQRLEKNGEIKSYSIKEK